MTGALNHIKVVDVSAARAGPSCVRILADFGARVVQVVRPGISPVDAAMTSFDRENLHRNKRSVAIDLQSAEGHELFLRLVKDADVLVENFRPDVKYRLKIDYDTLSALNPRLVYGSISGFGQDGPYGPLPGVDQIAQGMGGLMSITGPPGSGPWRVGIAICDLAAGTFLANGILAALVERNESGHGQWVQTSLLEAVISLLDFQATRWLIAHEVAPQAGNDHPTVFPTGVFPAADGVINIAATGDRQFREFSAVIGLPELADDERFSTGRARGQNREELRRICEQRTRQFEAADLIARLNQAGVPAGPILTIDKVFENEQVRHLKLAQPIDSPHAGRIELVRSPVSLSRTPASIRTASPQPGEQTREVLAELGLASPEIEALAVRGVVA